MTLEALDHGIAEIKEYKSMVDTYHKSPHPPGGFDMDRYLVLCEKYAPIDVLGVVLDAYDRVRSSVDFHREMGLGYAEKCGSLRAEVEHLQKQLEQRDKKQ